MVSGLIFFPQLLTDSRIFPGNRHITCSSNWSYFINRNHLLLTNHMSASYLLFFNRTACQISLPSVISSRYQITPARQKHLVPEAGAQKRSCVITKMPTIRIFQPWLMKVFNWSLMAKPANAPTMVKGR